MDFPLRYCPDGWERLERLRGLYEKRLQDRIWACMEIPTEALLRFAERYPEGPAECPDLEERVAFWDGLLAERATVLDDSIAAAYLSELDQGLYGGIVGGEVRFMAHPENGWISSMVPPIFKEWSELERLSIETSSGAYRFYLRELRCFREAARGKFGISHFILIDSLNFVFELFGGTRTYLELLDHPSYVGQAVDFAYRLNLDVQQTFFREIPLLEGGTCSNMVQWIPGRIVSESVDPFHMTNVAYFERWGREPVERIFAAFDGGVLHIHGNGRHLLEAVSSLRGLKAIFLGDDKDIPTAFSVLAELKARTRNLPLVVQVHFPDFVAALEGRRLPGGVLYKVLDVPDLDTANRAMDRVRAYRV
ncbi:hypothetical protein SBA2_670085 [Acidobacteriia bacterium SbA2]|nr:hypothetical protein SBA2_670085 [Acidobacteriia bacterium SbA2]